MAKYTQCPECGHWHAKSWQISERVYEVYCYFCMTQQEIEVPFHHTLKTYTETIRQSIKRHTN